MAQLPPLPTLCHHVRELRAALACLPSAQRTNSSQGLCSPCTWLSWGVCALSQTGSGNCYCLGLHPWCESGLLTSSLTGSLRSKVEWAGVRASKSVLLFPVCTGSGALSSSTQLGVGTRTTEVAGALPRCSVCLIVMQLLVRLAPFGCQVLWSHPLYSLSSSRQWQIVKK